VAQAPLSDELALEALDAFREHGAKDIAARALNLPPKTFRHRLKIAEARGMHLTVRARTEAHDADGELKRTITQLKPEPGDRFEPPEGFAVQRIATYTGPDGRIVGQWQTATRDAEDTAAALRTVVDELKQDLPRVAPTKGPAHTNALLLNQYTITDLHMGMLAWGEETRGDNYDLQIAEQLLTDWFSAAIAMAPDAQVGLLAQLGDLMHHDSHESVTPAHRNVLDADSRLQKVIRVVIRVWRRIVAMLLEKHERVHLIMEAGNHDPASSAWLRELLFAMYEDEPRVTVDNSPSLYHAYEWGKTALFYHHGDKRKVKNVDHVFAGMFREIYGRAAYSYGHVGHLHSDEVVETNLMRVERHRTLAPADAYAAGGGWLSKRDAKVLTYHKEYGEVSRITLSPEMVRDAMQRRSQS
jgi:hypothetical protein